MFHLKDVHIFFLYFSFNLITSCSENTQSYFKKFLDFEISDRLNKEKNHFIKIVLYRDWEKWKFCRLWLRAKKIFEFCHNWLLLYAPCHIDSVQWHFFQSDQFFRNLQMRHEKTVGQHVSTSNNQLTMAGKFKFLFCMESKVAKFLSFLIS